MHFVSGRVCELYGAAKEAAHTAKIKLPNAAKQYLILVKWFVLRISSR